MSDEEGYPSENDSDASLGCSYHPDSPASEHAGIFALPDDHHSPASTPKAADVESDAGYVSDPCDMIVAGQPSALLPWCGGDRVSDSAAHDDADVDVTSRVLVVGAVQSLRDDSEQRLAVSCLHALETPRRMTDGTPHSNGTKYWTRAYFDTAEPRRGTTWTQTAELAGVTNPTRYDCEKVKDTCYEAAELVMLSSRLFVGAVADRIRRSINRKLETGIAVYMHGEMDEATYRLRVPTKRALSVLEQGRICDGQGQGPPKRQNYIEMIASEAKVQYSEASWAVLTRNTVSGKYTILRGDLPCPLQHMRRNTAENTLKCHDNLFGRVPGLSDPSFEDMFIHVIRGTCMDKHSANEKTTNKLRLLDKDGGRCRKRLALNCDVHPSASIVTRTWKLVNCHISGLLAWSLAEKGPGRFEELRQLLAEECVDMLHIKRSSFYSVCSRGDILIPQYGMLSDICFIRLGYLVHDAPPKTISLFGYGQPCYRSVQRWRCVREGWYGVGSGVCGECLYKCASLDGTRGSARQRVDATYVG